MSSDPTQQVLAAITAAAGRDLDQAGRILNELPAGSDSTALFVAIGISGELVRREAASSGRTESEILQELALDVARLEAGGA